MVRLEYYPVRWIMLLCLWMILLLDRERPAGWTRILITGNSLGVGRVIKYASRGRGGHGSTSMNVVASSKTSNLTYTPLRSFAPSRFRSILEIITRHRSLSNAPPQSIGSQLFWTLVSIRSIPFHFVKLDVICCLDPTSERVYMKMWAIFFHLVEERWSQIQ